MLQNGFIKLDYLESTGAQHINLNKKLDLRNKLFIDFQLTSGTLFGISSATAGTYAYEYSLFRESTIYWSFLYNLKHSFPTWNADRHTVVFSRGSLSMDGNELINVGIVERTTDAVCFLFARHRISQPFGRMVGKVYSFRGDGLYLHPMLAMPGTEYIDANTNEVVVASDYKPGMYDYESGKFFVNQGTGEDFLYSL